MAEGDLEVLLKRVSRCSHRPLLRSDNPREVLVSLMMQREPNYALADVTIHTADQPLSTVVDCTLKGLYRHLGLRATRLTRHKESTGAAMARPIRKRLYTTSYEAD